MTDPRYLDAIPAEILLDYQIEQVLTRKPGESVFETPSLEEEEAALMSGALDDFETVTHDGG